MNWNKLLIYDPTTNKKRKPIIKFNSGHGAILCNKCRKIIKQNLTWEEFRGKTNDFFCFDCAMEILNKIFCIKTPDHAIIEENKEISK
jgi:hypothetical protein